MPIALPVGHAPVREPCTLAEAAFFNAGVMAVLDIAAAASVATRQRSANAADALDELAAVGRALLVVRPDLSGQGGETAGQATDQGG